MNIRRNRTTNILTFFLLFLFIWFYSGITLFYHSHLVEGHIIVHSHPVISFHWNKKAKESHTHSASAFYLIHHINIICWDNDADVPEAPEPASFQVSYIKPEIIRSAVRSVYFPLCLRAPPAA